MESLCSAVVHGGDDDDGDDDKELCAISDPVPQLEVPSTL